MGSYKSGKLGSMKKLFLLIFLFLTSCSFKSLVVPNLAFIIADRIDSSLHLYNEQEYQVRGEIQKLLKEEKSRIEEIQKYFNKIDIKNIDEKEGYAFFAKNYYQLAKKVNRILAKQFAALDKNQISKFKESMIKDNKEIEERSRERKPEDFYKRYSYFFGELTRDQKELIKKNMSLFRELANRRLIKRRETQKEILRALLLKNSEEKEKLITALFDKNADRSKLTPERIKSLNQFKSFVSSLTLDQEKYFKKKSVFFNEWIDEYLKQY